MVDAILVIGENVSSRHLSEFYLYVGFDSDYTQNTQCPGGPFAFPRDSNYGTYNGNGKHTGTDWINGEEVWCNLPGSYVSFVREADAEPITSGEIVICTFGVISDG